MSIRVKGPLCWAAPALCSGKTRIPEGQRECLQNRWRCRISLEEKGVAVNEVKDKLAQGLCWTFHYVFFGHSESQLTQKPIETAIYLYQ